MKIIYLHQYFNTPNMSGSTRSYEMGRRLVTEGHEVHIVTSHCEGSAPIAKGWYKTTEAGMSVHWLVNPYSNRMSYRRRILAFIRYAILSSLKAARLGGDVVFASSTPLTVAIPALFASRINAIPMVFEIRDLWPEGPIRVGALKDPFSITAAKWLERVAYKGSKHVVALSPRMKRGVIKTGYPEKQVTIIPNSSDIDMFRIPAELGQSFLKRHPFLESGPVVCYIGTLGLINGVDYLVEIAKEMLNVNPSVKFLIVGDGREKAHIQKRALELEVLGKNLWMFPRVPKREVPILLSASAVASSLIIELPHNQAESANKTFDAFAAGKPLMINHGGLIADLLSESGAGLVIPPRQPAIAAKLLNAFLNDKAKMEKASKASAELADTRFNRDLHARQLSQILESVVSGKRYMIKSVPTHANLN